MIRNYLDVCMANSDMTLVEEYVETICNHYNINNAYFGHIMFSVTELFRIISEDDTNNKKMIRIEYSSEKGRIKFLFHLKEIFHAYKGLLLLNEEELINRIDLNHKEQGVLAIKLLCDEVNVVEGAEGVEVVFFIGSINHAITKDRRNILESYFTSILLPKD